MKEEVEEGTLLDLKKLENADEMLRCLPSFLVSSAAEGLPTEEVDSFYDEKLRRLSPENTKDLDTFS